MKLASLQKTFVKINDNWKEWLVFSRKDRIGILSLITLLLIIWFTPIIAEKTGLLRPTPFDTNWNSKLLVFEIDSNAERYPDKRGEYQKKSNQWTYERPATHARTFEFNPNTIDAADWLRLGLRSRTIETITKFKSKGGRFYKPEDLKKIYGMSPKLVEQLIPFVRIENEKKEPFNDRATEHQRTAYKTNDFQSKKSIITIDVNDADTTAFIQLPGIGSKLAQRIISFREKLGGFYSVNQVAETFGIADSVFGKMLPYLELKNQTIRKINLNKATIEELKAHPYIRYQLANLITSYRKEHGEFKSIDDIKNIMSITEETFRKLKPYLTID